ncbi:cell division protein ZapC [Pseudoalteromonas sp. SG45-5]|uniref:cell division protein ZapC n=1 Tax=unclassified Pseudoalteromonas TaxID=194690 RepID=UPI0015FC2AE6|nr:MULTISPECIES: cell division protein ZapC [unclassified Pseudoalteromonas]MBB1386294.1 cell division protein ZapC [Pseudoalteromonas sp. SG45-5]MBB1394335.1 cell division protein ZapC [Pseudoalteromonas sp. SG44-4]MBB1448366.1 cell division protein ZapC [Pseudoalteromonas sp. SG41-6]
MLQASKQWQWIACADKNRLLLDLNDDMQLCTPYKLRLLTDSAFKNPYFSVEDAAFYEQVYNYLVGFNVWSPAKICQISLNATAVKYHLKPVLAKSWFFKEYTGSDPSVEAIVKLTSKAQSGDFLIVEHCPDASICLNLSEDFKLDENLSLTQFEVVRILNNRVHPILNQQYQSQTA